MEFIRKYWLRIVLILACNRLLLAVIGAISIETFAPHFQKPEGHVFAQSLLLVPWGGWDTSFYMTIVRDGYMSPDGNTMQIGWFPLYPIAVKATSFVVSSPFVAGLVVSNLCLLAAVLLMGAWLSKQQDETTAFHAILFLIFYPKSLVLSSALSESLFLLLLVGSLFLVHLKKAIGACAVFSLLLITRPVGIAIVPFFVFSLLPLHSRDAKTWIRALSPLLLLPIPFLLYHGYLWRLTGDPLAYVSNKVMYHQHAPTNPLAVVFDALLRGVTEHRFEHAFNALMALLGSLLVFFNRKLFGWNYVLIGLTLIVFPLATGGWLISSSRYVAVSVPVFTGLSVVASRYACKEWLFMICLVLQGFVMVMWSIGGRF